MSGLTQGDTILQFAPLGFTRTGNYDWYSAALNGRGSVGRLWSRRSYSTTDSYVLNFRSTYVGPRGSLNRGDGYSLRCLAR